MKLHFRIRTASKAKQEKAFIRNGSILLQEVIAFYNGRYNSIPICAYSAKELKTATNNYDKAQLFHENRFYKFYKGSLRDQQVLIKKFKSKYERIRVVFNDIVIASSMSIHNNVLKLLGCCLETEVPTLVFEFAESRNLGDLVYSQKNNCNFKPLSWKCRVKIAMDIANVVAYLHTAFPKPIIHRDIHCLHILVSKDCTAKLSDFSVSWSSSHHENDDDVKDGVEEIMGHTDGVEEMMGLTPTEYMAKNDVYNVGIFYLMLLTGQPEICKDPLENNKAIYITDYVERYVDNNGINEILDPMIFKEEVLVEEQQQMEGFKALAMNCILKSARDRPTITDVAKKLRQIYQGELHATSSIHINKCWDSSSTI